MQSAYFIPGWASGLLPTDPESQPSNFIGATLTVQVYLQKNPALVHPTAQPKPVGILMSPSKSKSTQQFRLAK
jgi:hypothetical protein